MIEGAGGLMVPLIAPGLVQIDVFREMGAPVMFARGPGWARSNHTLLVTGGAGGGAGIAVPRRRADRRSASGQSETRYRRFGGVPIASAGCRVSIP